MPVRLHDALPAAAAALVLLAMGCGGRAQTVDLRGTSDQEQALQQTEAPPPVEPEPAPPPPATLTTPSLTPLPPLVQSPPLFGTPPDAATAPNYGKPRPKKPKLYKLYKPNPKASPPLPALAPYTSAPPPVGLRKTTLPPQPVVVPPPDPDAAVPLPAPNYEAVPAPPPLRRPKPDPDPFAPTGIDVGSLRLFPFVETGVGYDTNPNRLALPPKGSVYLRADTGLKVESQWSQHSLTADLHGGYSDFLQFHEADRPDAAGTIVGRVDVLRDTQINSESRFNISTQQPGSAQIAIPGSVFIVNRPLIVTYGETLGLTQNFNRLQVSLRGSFDRYTYADGEQSNGTELLLSTENYNDYGLTGRVGYELTPGIMPFVQLGGDLRRHDQFLDFNGFARDSDGVAVKVGSKFELTRLLTGELSVGYAERHYDDGRLPLLNAPTVDGTIVYTASPLTTLTLKTSTDLAETTDANTAGAIDRLASFEIAHALLRNLTIKATGTYQNFHFVGENITEDLVTGVLAADYNLTREIVLRASYSHEHLFSNVVGNNYDANVFLLGVRLQR